jgi:hypothetical protein
MYCRTSSAAVEANPARGNTVFLLKVWEYGRLYFHQHSGAYLSRLPLAKIRKYICAMHKLHYVLIKVFLSNPCEKAM